MTRPETITFDVILAARGLDIPPRMVGTLTVPWTDTETPTAVIAQVLIRMNSP